MNDINPETSLIGVSRAVRISSIYPLFTMLFAAVLKVYPSVVGPTAHALGIPLTSHTLTDERIESSSSKCTYYEAAKQLGFADTPLCEGLCKAVSESLLKLIALEHSKTIVKSLWKGDDECRFEITKT